jgi:MarR family transcriptional regulator, transcriptional regulator for hemolysin
MSSVNAPQRRKSTINAATQRGSREFLDPSELLGFRLIEAGRLYRRHFQERHQELALDLTQCRALFILAKNESITQQRLAELLAIDAAALVRVLDRLEARGWAERRSRLGDRRARSLAITQGGKALLPLIRKIVNESQRAALAGLSREETQLLAKVLDCVLANLKAYEIKTN